MRRNTFCIIIFIFVLSISFTDIATSRPDGHAPIGVMGEHAHKAGEMMLAYRFMAHVQRIVLKKVAVLLALFLKMVMR